MSGMQMDVQNVLEELRTIKTTQKNLVDRVDSLEEVLGVSHKKAGQKQVRGRPSNGNVKDKAADEVGALEEGNQASQAPVANLVDRLGAIEVAVEKLLDRTESRSCERSTHRHVATSPPPASFPLDTTVAGAGHSIPAQVIPLQTLPVSETLSHQSKLAHTSTTETQSSVQHASVQVCDSPSACSALAHGEQCHFSFVPAIWNNESGSVSSAQGSEGSVDPTRQRSLSHDPACPSDGLHSTDKVVTASSGITPGSLVIPPLSLQPRPPSAPTPNIAKSAPSALPPSILGETDTHFSLDSATPSTLVDIAPATKDVSISVGSSVLPSVPGTGALAGVSSRAHVTTPVLPDVFHRASMDNSRNQEVDNGVLNGTSVKSFERSNGLQLQSSPLWEALSGQVTSSASSSPLVEQLLKTIAGFAGRSVDTISPVAHPVNMRTDRASMGIETSGLNLTPAEATLSVSTRTTVTDSCGVDCSSDVRMEDQDRLADTAPDGGSPRNIQCNRDVDASTSEPWDVSKLPHGSHSEASVNTDPRHPVSSHRSSPLLTDGGRENTPADSQHTQEEEDVLQSLLPTTPATAMVSPASVPSLILPSMTASRCPSVVPHSGAVRVLSQQAEKLEVSSVLPDSDPAPDIPDPYSVVQSAPSSGEPSSSLSSTSSTHAPLSTPPSPLTPITANREPSEAESLQDDTPLLDYVAKHSRDLTLGRKCGGPSAPLSELMQLARRESPANCLKGSKGRKRRRGSQQGTRDEDVTNSTHPSSSQPAVAPGIEAGMINIADLEGVTMCDSEPVGNAISLAEHSGELVPRGTDSLKIIIPAKKRIKIGETSMTESEVSKYQGSSPNGTRNRDIRPRYVLLNGKVVRMDSNLSRDNGGFDLKSTARTEYHPPGETPARPRGKRKSAVHAKGATSRPSRRKPDTIAAAALPDMPSHQRTVILQFWPEIKQSSDSWERQLIQCDNCDMWYHYGCVGVEKDDPRLDSEAAFICPLCFVQIARRQTTRNRTETCARPDCPHVAEAEDGLYFVERLVGRESVGQAGYRWLAKWDGYPMSEASWIPEGNVTGHADNLLKQFEEDARREGLDLSEELIILSEAAAAGWPC